MRGEERERGRGRGEERGGVRKGRWWGSGKRGRIIINHRESRVKNPVAKNGLKRRGPGTLEAGTAESASLKNERMAHFFFSFFSFCLRFFFLLFLFFFLTRNEYLSFSFLSLSSFSLRIAYRLFPPSTSFLRETNILPPSLSPYFSPFSYSFLRRRHSKDILLRQSTHFRIHR